MFSFVVQVFAGRNLEWADVSKMSALLQVHATVDLRSRQGCRSCRHTTQTTHPWSYTESDNMTTAYTEHMHSISPPCLLNGKCKPTHNKHIHHHYHTALVHAVRQWLPMATASTVALTMDARKSSLEERVCVKAGFLAESLWMYSSPNMMAQGEMLPSLLKENKTR